MADDVTFAEIAQQLGMKESEIVDAFETEAGLVVALFDHTQVIIVPEDRPDAEGKTGTMYFTAPELSGQREYTGDAAVYAQPLESDPADAVGADTDYPEKAAPDLVLQWVAGDEDRAREALANENARKRPRKDLVDELEGIVAQYVDPAENAEAAVEAAHGAAEAEQS